MRPEYDFENSLTNEQLLKRYKNQFELVRIAIQLAGNAIRSGREPDVDTDSENLAFMILAEISSSKDRIEAVPVREEAPIKEPANSSFLQQAKELKKERRSKSKVS